MAPTEKLVKRKRGRPRKHPLPEPSKEDLVVILEGDEKEEDSVVTRQIPVAFCGAIEKFFFRLSDFCARHERYPRIAVIPNGLYGQLVLQVNRSGAYQTAMRLEAIPTLAGIKIFRACGDNHYIEFG